MGVRAHRSSAVIGYAAGWMGLVALIGSAGSAFAQSTAPAQAAAPDSGRLDEVIVTARRRSESLQNVPVAVSAFNAARLPATARVLRRMLWSR